MATYVPNAVNTAEPIESRNVESAALEFRTLKAEVLTSLRVPEATVADLPSLAMRGNRLLAFDAAGNPIAGPLSNAWTAVGNNIANIDTVAANIVEVIDVSLHMPTVQDAARLLSQLEDGIALLAEYLKSAPVVLVFPLDLGSVAESVDSWPYEFGLVADSAISSSYDLGLV